MYACMYIRMYSCMYIHAYIHTGDLEVAHAVECLQGFCYYDNLAWASIACVTGANVWGGGGVGVGVGGVKVCG
jgi:hypothetical protein